MAAELATSRITEENLFYELHRNLLSDSTLEHRRNNRLTEGGPGVDGKNEPDIDREIPQKNTRARRYKQYLSLIKANLRNLSAYISIISFVCAMGLIFVAARSLAAPVRSISTSGESQKLLATMASRIEYLNSYVAKNTGGCVYYYCYGSDSCDLAVLGYGRDFASCDSMYAGGDIDLVIIWKIYSKNPGELLRFVSSNYGNSYPKSKIINIQIEDIPFELR
jgi:hypothetical protein